jgi:diadenosine tetraphosphate (Ap4A) HIT family hydrolase
MFAEADFVISEQLESDKQLICDLKLSAVYLNNDKQWPWVVLVPRKNDMVEFTDLEECERMELMREMSAVQKAIVEGWPEVSKMNLGMIGCVCRQLHVHVLGRFVGDCCWPQPVWGAAKAVKYEEREKVETCAKIRELLRKQIDIIE